MWAGEATKAGLDRDELARSYGDVQFGDSLRYVPDCSEDRDEVRAFLLEHYDPNACDMIQWVLDSSQMQTALRSARTNKLVAYMAGIGLPVRTAEFEGKVLLGTLLCVLPALRSTGLVRKFLAANMRLSAERRYAVRCSTATTAIALNPVCVPQRYVCWPGERHAAKGVLRAASLLPVSTARRKAMAVLRGLAPRSGIRWSQMALPDHPSVTYVSSHTKTASGSVAAVLLSVNAASSQVLGAAASDPALLRPLLVWAASYFRKAVVIDATHPGSLHRDVAEWCTPDEVNPRYHVYFHNVAIAPQECGIPML